MTTETIIPTKVCTQCGTEKSVTEYYKKKNGDPTSECKKCKNAMNKRWYGNHREERIKQTSAYQRARPEKAYEWTAKWRARHPEKAGEWQRSNWDRALENARRWHKQDREMHPERYLVWQHRARAKREGVVGRFTVEEWLALLAACDFRCCRCGMSEEELEPYCSNSGVLEVDHILPIRLGGENTIANIQPLCGPCNNWKRRKCMDFRPDHVKALFR